MQDSSPYAFSSRRRSQASPRLTALILVGLTACSHAALTGFQSPVGWKRNDPGSAWLSADQFTGISGSAADMSGPSSSGGVSAPRLEIITPDTDAFGPLLLGAPSDNRIYTGDEAVVLSLAGNSAFAINSALLQVREIGGPNGFDTITLAGFSPGKTSSTEDQTGGRLWRYEWSPTDLRGGLSAGDFEFHLSEKAIGHLSVDSVVADVSEFAIPEPSTMLLLSVAALTALSLDRRRRRAQSTNAVTSVILFSVFSLAGFFACLPTQSHAQSAAFGEFYVPAWRSDPDARFSYWVGFSAPYLQPNFPRSSNVDSAGNPSNYNDNAALIQDADPEAFITGSASIYSHSGVTSFRIDYTHDSAAPVTRVICQTLTGGARIDLDRIWLEYETNDGTVQLHPEHRMIDNPGSGAFLDRIAAGFEWNLSGRDVAGLRIRIQAPGRFMPLYQVQLDVAVLPLGAPDLGRVIRDDALPVPLNSKAGAIHWEKVSGTGDARFFRPGDQATLRAEPSSGFAFVRWGGGVSGSEPVINLTFPDDDLHAIAYFRPVDYAAWRRAMFDPTSREQGIPEDDINDLVSGLDADPDGDGIPNRSEYAFAGNPYLQDPEILPQCVLAGAQGARSPHLLVRRWPSANAAFFDHHILVETSTDLLHWQEHHVNPAESTLPLNNAANGAETALFPINQPNQTSMFARGRVILDFNNSSDTSQP